jgi:3-hydroxyacyl-[acyl-carrier-protein] dehydratase
MEMVDIREIMQMIPHRYPFLLVDRVTSFVQAESIVGIKNVTFNEPHFTGHFPDNPVMPGVLMIEAMAQISAVLVAKTLNARPDEKIVYFMSISNAKFRKVVQPGDQLCLRSKIVQHREQVWKFDACAEVDGEIVAESLFTAMVKDRLPKVQ